MKETLITGLLVLIAVNAAFATLFFWWHAQTIFGLKACGT